MCAQAEDSPRTKRCSKCGEEKAADEFSRRPLPSGNVTLVSSCKQCQREAARKPERAEQRREASRRSNQKRRNDPAYRAKQVMRSAEWAAANPERYQRNQRRYQRKRRGMTGSELDWCEVLDHDPCAYCGVLSAPGIDHILPESGGGTHDAANLTACCMDCNLRKRAEPLLSFLLEHALKSDGLLGAA